MPDTRLFASDAKEVAGYLNAGDDRTGRPTVVVAHEFWGLNDQIRGVVDRIARHGFVAFAPDLYHGRVAKSRDEARELMKHLDWSGVELDLRATAHALQVRDPTSKLGIMGFCMGGAVALFGAAKIPEYAACVPFYGIPARERADLSKIQGRVQAHFALEDDWCTGELIGTLEKQLTAGGVGFEVHRYEAKHGFANETRPEVYDEEASKLAWERSFKFLHDVLG